MIKTNWLGKKIHRIQAHVKPEVAAFIDDYGRSRDMARSDVGTEALLLYFAGYNWCPSWVSIEDILDTPKGDRNKYVVEAYANQSYLDWLGDLPENALAYLPDLGRKQELEEEFSKGIFLKIRGEALHLRRALMLYCEVVKVCPELMNFSLDRIRPDNYQVPHDFNNTEYLWAYTSKIIEMTGIDFSKPPKR